MKIIVSVFLFISLLIPQSSFASAEPQIKCTAEASEILSSGQLKSESKPLDTVDESKFYISLSTDLQGKNFSLSGSKTDGIFYVSITDLPDHTSGSMTTASFGSDSRVQISIVNKNMIYKLECFNR
jgi:hypothetical protein